MSSEKKFTSFWAFYPYYLTEHARPVNRLLHFTGTSIVIACFVCGIAFQNGKLLFALPFAGYGFAWVGHFVFEKNRPATFQYPLYSLGSDFVMFWHMLTFQINEKLAEAHRSLGLENKWA